MMLRPVQVMVVVLSVALAAPTSNDDYTMTVPRKRAALVLDRLLIALQKALHETSPNYQQVDRDGPRFAPLRIASADMSGGGGDWLSSDELRVAPLLSHTDDLTGLQRRGQTGGAQGVRGRVLRCYFNAVTCF